MTKSPNGLKNEKGLKEKGRYITRGRSRNSQLTIGANFKESHSPWANLEK